MANFNADNYASVYVNQPASALKPSDKHGRVRYWSDKYTLGAELALNDTITLLRLPKGAKVVDARIVFPNDGTTGQLDLGWNSNGTDAADQDGFFAGATEGDFGGGAVDAKLLGTAAGFQKEFAEETQVVATCVEASTASNGNEFKFELFYIVD